jgi:sulfhydrogenase subunit beta (sulfur reductase)
MKIKRIEKEKIPQFLQRCSEQREVWGPIKTPSGDIFISPLSEGELTLEYLRPHLPPKAALFPQREKVFEYDGQSINPWQDTSPKLIFGIRSCDLMGVLFTDKFFKKNFDDPLYRARRENTLFISIACNQPDLYCFCTSTQTGPSLNSGFDLQMFDNGDDYLVQIGSEKGELLIQEHNQLFSEAGPEAVDRMAELMADSVSRFTYHPEIRKAEEVIRGELDEEKVWKPYADRCIACGGCSYVCPTCTCFGIYDRGKEERGARYRYWDSCLFAGYTREASGHNPRGREAQRIRQRFEHKLGYDPINMGMDGCMGCGRCNLICPAGMGIIDVINTLAQYRSD